MNDEIIEQLRAKGYFDGPLTGYLSHQLPPDLPPWKAVLRLSVQVGLVGGVAMGIIFSFAVLLLNPFLYQFPLEFIKLFFGLTFGFSYLGCLFLCFTGLLQISLLRLRGKPLSIEHFLAFRAGELAGVSLFCYGASWWWTLAISTESYSLFSWQTGLLFSILFGISLYLSKLINNLTRYRNFKEKTKQKEIFGLALFAGFILLFLQFYFSVSKSDLAWTAHIPKQDKTITPLLVLGIDGLTLENLEHYIDKGKLPHFARLLQQGSQFQLTGFEGDQASEWITLLTGHSTLVHGVKGLSQTKYPANIQPLGPEKLWTYLFPFLDRQALITTNHRRVKFLWEIASEAGLSNASVNCWGTWPAEPVQGTLFSDRLIPSYITEQFLGKESYPTTSTEQVKAFYQSAKRNTEKYSKLARPSYLVDTFTTDLLDFSLKEKPQVSVAYFQGLDILQQKLKGLDFNQSQNVEKKMTLPLEYYQFLDQLLGKYMSRYRIVLMAGPGFLTGDKGLFLTYGEGFLVGAKGTGKTLQVLPTLLHAIGLPCSKKMLIELPVFKADFPFPLQEVDSFGTRVPVKEETSSSSNLEEYYRSLGYL